MLRKASCISWGQRLRLTASGRKTTIISHIPHYQYAPILLHNKFLIIKSSRQKSGMSREKWSRSIELRILWLNIRWGRLPKKKTVLTIKVRIGSKSWRKIEIWMCTVGTRLAKSQQKWSITDYFLQKEFNYQIYSQHTGLIRDFCIIYNNQSFFLGEDLKRVGKRTGVLSRYAW